MRGYKEILFVVIACAFSACRSSHFEHETIGLEQSLKSTETVQAEYGGECSEFEDCYITRMSFQLKNNRGQELVQTQAQLTVNHEKVIAPKLTATSDDRAMVNFDLKFKEFPTERGQQLVVGLELHVEGWGTNYYCAKIEPSNRVNPLVEIKACDGKTFRPVTVRSEPKWKLSIEDIRLIGEAKQVGALAELPYRAHFRLRNPLTNQLASGFRVEANLSYRNKDFTTKAITDASGEFNVDFPLIRSAYENEERALVRYEMKWGPASSEKTAGYCSLDLQNSSGNAIVFCNTGEPPKPLVQSRYGQVSSNVTYFRLMDGPTFSANDDLRLTENFSAQIQIAFQIHKQTLLHDITVVPLRNLEIIGKIFFVERQPTSDPKIDKFYILSESVFHSDLTRDGNLELSVSPSWERFALDLNEVEIIIAAALPGLPESPIFYQNYRQSFDQRWAAFDLSEQRATDILRSHLIDIQAPYSKPTEPSRKAEDIFKGTINLEKDTIKGLEENQKRIVTLLKRSSSRDSDTYWREILTLLNPVTPAKGQVKGPIDAVVREYIFPTTEVKNANPQVSAEAYQDMSGERISLDFAGEGIHCYLIQTADATVEYSYCLASPERFQITETWLRLRKGQSPAILVRTPFGGTAIQNDLFSHPEKYKNGVLERILWPASKRDR